MDTVANLLIALVNAENVGKERFAVPYSRYKERLANLLLEHGVVRKVRAQRTVRPKLIITLTGGSGRTARSSSRWACKSSA